MIAGENRWQRELRHIQFGPAKGEMPIGLGTVRFTAKCACDSPDVHFRAKDVLEKLVQGALNQWPGDAEWQNILPDWFVSKCAPEISEKDAEAELQKWRSNLNEKAELQVARWTLLGWTHWFQADNRKWYWWDSEERDLSTIVVAVEVDDWPFPWGSLSWLFLAAGAIEIDAEQ